MRRDALPRVRCGVGRGAVGAMNPQFQAPPAVPAARAGATPVGVRGAASPSERGAAGQSGSPGGRGPAGCGAGEGATKEVAVPWIVTIPRERLCFLDRSRPFGDPPKWFLSPKAIPVAAPHPALPRVGAPLGAAQAAPACGPWPVARHGTARPQLCGQQPSIAGRWRSMAREREPAPLACGTAPAPCPLLPRTSRSCWEWGILS